MIIFFLPPPFKVNRNWAFLLLAFENRSDILISASRFFVCMLAYCANNVVKMYLWILLNSVYAYTFVAKCVIVLFLGVTFSLRIRVNLTWTHNWARYNLRIFFVRVSDVDLLVNSVLNISFIWNPSSVVHLNLSCFWLWVFWCEFVWCHVTCIEIILIVVKIQVIKVLLTKVLWTVAVCYGY